ncbi:MAG: hypothetical protein M3365_05820 [Gemmatimonadota bacterium]|nr:hypothetical protein [Gemmatimonadota bacterium]
MCCGSQFGEPELAAARRAWRCAQPQVKVDRAILNPARMRSSVAALPRPIKPCRRTVQGPRWFVSRVFAMKPTPSATVIRLAQ